MQERPSRVKRTRTGSGLLWTGRVGGKVWGGRGDTPGFMRFFWQDQCKIKKEGGKTEKVDGKTKKEDGKAEKEDGKTEKEDGKTEKEDGKTKKEDGKTEKDDGKAEKEDRKMCSVSQNGQEINQ